MGNTQHTGPSVETTMLSSGFIPGDIVFTTDMETANNDKGKVDYYVVQSVQTMTNSNDFEQSGDSGNESNDRDSGNSGQHESDQHQIFPNQQQRLLFTVVAEPLASFFHRRKGTQIFTESSSTASSAKVSHSHNSLQRRLHQQRKDVETSQTASVGEEWKCKDTALKIPKFENLRSDQLSVIEDDQHARRRIEYRILQVYISECERLTTEECSVMSQRFIHVLSECMLEGEPLREIDLSQENLSDLHLEPLCTVLRDPECMVVKINLSNNALGPKAAVKISQIMQHSRTVSEIDLSGNNLTYEGAVTLSHQIRKDRTLTVLSLANTGIGPKGCDLIIDALICNPHHCIMKLDLRYNGCTEPQITSLLQLAEQQRQLCFTDIYPHHCNDTTGHAHDGSTSSSPRPAASPSSAAEAWLTLQGWTLYGKLRTALSNNIEYVQQNPNICIHRNKGSAWIRDVEDVKDYILYNLSIAKQGILDPLINPDVHSISSAHHQQSQEAKTTEGNQKHGNKKENVKNFFEWRLQKQRLQEYRQLQTSIPSPSSSSSQTKQLVEFRNDLHTKRLSQRCSTVSTPVSSSVDIAESSSSSAGTMQSTTASAASAENSDWLMVESDPLAQARTTTITGRRDPLILCKICMEEKPASAIYILDHCYHKFCLACIETYICVKIQNFEVDSIRCPECSDPISHNETEMLLKVQGHQNMIKLFQKFSLKKTLLSMPGMIWCPNPQCSNAMLIDIATDDGDDNASRTSSSSEKNKNDVHKNRHEDNITVPKFDAIHGMYFQDPIPDNSGGTSSTPVPLSTSTSSSRESRSTSIYPSSTHNQQYEFEDQYMSLYTQSHHPHHERSTEVLAQYSPPPPPSHTELVYSRGPTLHLDSNRLMCSYAYNPEYDHVHFIHRSQQQVQQQYHGQYSRLQGQSTAIQLQGKPNQTVDRGTHQQQQPTYLSPLVQQPAQQQQKQLSPAYHLAPVVTCQECKWVICTECKLKSHAGQTCLDARNEREQSADETFNDWLRDHNAKQCPHCGITIDKKSGCNDMHCKNCNGHFCWVCLAKLGKHDDDNEEGGTASIQRSVRHHFTNGSCFKYSLASLFSL